MATALQKYASPDSNCLFDASILKTLKFSECSSTTNGGFYHSPGPGLVTRPLERTDFTKGYLLLLSQLTKVGEYSKETFEVQFDGMKQMPGCHYIIVVEDTSTEQLICTGTLLVECKFIHNAALRGRIEDIVVHKDYRNLRLGSMIVELLTALGKELGCYKVTLDCKENMLGFYTKFGYVNEGQFYLSRRFFD